MRILDVAAIVGFAAAALPQGLTVNATVVASGAAAGGQFASFAPGTPIANLMTISASGAGQSALTSLAFSPTPYANRLNVWQSSGASGSSGGASTSATVRLTLTAPRAVYALLNVAQTPQWTPGSNSSSTIDVGANGFIELSVIPFAQPVQTLPITSGPGVIPIQIYAATQSMVGFFISSTSMTWTLSYSLVPDPDWTTIAMPTDCGPGAPDLVAQPTCERDIEFQLSGLVPSSTTVGVLVLGLIPVSVLIPLPPFCSLGTSADDIGLFVPSAAGTAAHRLDMNPLPPGFAFSAQALALDLANGELRSSVVLRTTKF